MRTTLFIAWLGAAVACSTARESANTEFDRLQERGHVAMGVDQYQSTHRFDSSRNGGRIELQSDNDAAADVQTIRTHLRGIAAAFKSGDFTTPLMVHGIAAPGTDVMARLKDVITYTYADLPRGGEVRITADDAGAVEAIHTFLAFQRGDHRSTGVDEHGAAGAGAGHEFTHLPDGAQIALLSGSFSEDSIQLKRAHLKEKLAEFRTSGFTPGRPGADLLNTLRAEVGLAYRDLPRGGAITITSRNASAVIAIRQFVDAMKHAHHHR